MNSNFVSIVCLILLGICCFKTANASIAKGGWSDLKCDKIGEVCFQTRICTSTDNFNCSKTNEINVTDCPCVAEWSSWGEWNCKQENNRCWNVRYRTCINGNKEKGCSDLPGNEFEITNRECDNTCKKNDTASEHTDGWSDLKCEEINNRCYKIHTNTNEINITDCPCVAEWSPWGGWTCHPDQVVCLKLRQRTCISGFKKNDCLELQGDHYETDFCDESCYVTSSTPAPQSALSPSTSSISSTTKGPIVITKETLTISSVNLGSYTSTSTNATTITSTASTSQKHDNSSTATSSMSTQSELQSLNASTSSFKMTSYLTTFSTKTTMSTPLSTSKPIGESSAAYIYWLEWTGWKCKDSVSDSNSVCLMSRTRNCSTYKPFDCEEKLGGEHFHVEPCKKEICPVKWSEWGNWTCRIENDGACYKTRSRKCSTGSDAQCGLDSLERQPCDNITCPELNKLGQLGYCKKHDSQSCVDAESCKNPNIQLVCARDAHVASMICPKACGCCHVDPEWSSWSEWRCERTKTMCRMKQNRTCSTGNTTDCEGISVKQAACDERLCPEPTWQSWSGWECQLRPNNTCKMSRYRKCSDEDFCNGENHEEDECSSEMCPDFVDFQVNCSLHNTKSDECVDGVGCHLFKNTPKSLCLDDAVACPVTCGCCLPSTSPGVTTNNSIGVTTQNPSASNGNGSNGTGSEVTTNNQTGVTTLTPTGSGGNGSNGTGSGATTNNTIGISTQNPPGSDGNGSNGTGSGVTTSKPIGVSTQNQSVSSGNSSNGTGSGVTTNNQTGVNTQNPSGSIVNGSNGTGTEVTTNNPIGITTQNPSGSGGNGSNGTGSVVTTNNTIDITTQNPSGSGGNGSNGTGSGVTTNSPIGATTQNTSGSSGNGSNGTGSGVTTNITIGITTQNPSGSGGNGSNGTGSGVTTNSPIGASTQNTSGSGGNGSNGTSSGVTTNNTIGITTQNPSGSGGNGSNGPGSGVTTNSPIGANTQTTSGSGGNGSNGTGSGVTTNNTIGITTRNPSGSGENGSNGTGSGVTTNSQIGITTQNPSGTGVNGSNGTSPGETTNTPPGVTTQNPSESGGNGSNGTGSGVTTNNTIGITTQNPSGSGGNGSNGTGSGVTTNNPPSVTTQIQSGSGGNVSNGTGSGVTTNNPIGITTQNPSGSGVNGSNGTGSGVTTINTNCVTSQNPSGSGGNGSNGPGSGVTTNNTIGITTQNPSGSGANGSNGLGSGVTTNKTNGMTTQNPSRPGGNVTNNASVASTPLPIITSPSMIKTTTTTQKQPHTPTPAAVTCNVCAGPEFLCEKLFAPQTCSPPNNYCINKLTNHIDGTRMVTRHCGNFDTCYREWFLGSSDSDKCRNFEDNNIITLDFDCTYCCTSDNCNKPIKPLDKDLYKDL